VGASEDFKRNENENELKRHFKKVENGETKFNRHQSDLFYSNYG